MSSARVRRTLNLKVSFASRVIKIESLAHHIIVSIIGQHQMMASRVHISVIVTIWHFCRHDTSLGTLLILLAQSKESTVSLWNFLMVRTVALQHHVIALRPIFSIAAACAVLQVDVVDVVVSKVACHPIERVL